MTCCALLDDRAATPERPTSRLYTGFAHEHRCVDPATLDAVWRQVEADQQQGLHALILADYEWGAKLLHAGDAGLRPDDASALRVLMFRELAHLSRAAADAWLQAQDDGATQAGAAGAIGLQASVDRAGFVDAIGRIHTAIRNGETYQVNHTYRLDGHAHGTPLALYRRLRAHQPVAYGACIVLPPGGQTTHVLSCSPELFLRHEGGTLTARPMKGTAAREQAPEGDSETARHLAIDVKNRAENLMIVDLLRNDLGRLAVTGSVRVPELFAIEPYATVFQMTSTVQAQLPPERRFTDVLRATFPCGSITGAPKHHTMELIAGLETTPRGLYCGAIGWLDAAPAGRACGDFCLSVAIRTVTLGPPAAGLRPLRLGIGAGIVMDSRADDEFDECQLKARFLTGLDPGFQLFETLRAEAGQVALLTQHLNRLEHSAATLGFAFDRAHAADRLQGRAAALAAPGPWRVRLALAQDGRIELGHAPLAPLPADAVLLRLADAPLPDARPLAAHKTTLRAAYDEGVQAAEQAGAFDTLFFDRRGHLVEGGRSSVFARIDGDWFTPPLGDGALPGVMRARLLADPAWAARERSLTLADLRGAQALAVCNALRGVLPASLMG